MKVRTQIIHNNNNNNNSNNNNNNLNFPPVQK